MKINKSSKNELDKKILIAQIIREKYLNTINGNDDNKNSISYYEENLNKLSYKTLEKINNGYLPMNDIDKEYFDKVEDIDFEIKSVEFKNIDGKGNAVIMNVDNKSNIFYFKHYFFINDNNYYEEFESKLLNYFKEIHNLISKYFEELKELYNMQNRDRTIYDNKIKKLDLYKKTINENKNNLKNYIRYLINYYKDRYQFNIQFNNYINNNIINLKNIYFDQRASKQEFKNKSEQFISILKNKTDLNEIKEFKLIDNLITAFKNYNKTELIIQKHNIPNFDTLFDKNNEYLNVINSDDTQLITLFEFKIEPTVSVRITTEASAQKPSAGGPSTPAVVLNPPPPAAAPAVVQNPPPPPPATANPPPINLDDLANVNSIISTSKINKIKYKGYFIIYFIENYDKLDSDTKEYMEKTYNKISQYYLNYLKNNKKIKILQNFKNILNILTNNLDNEQKINISKLKKSINIDKNKTQLINYINNIKTIDFDKITDLKDTDIKNNLIIIKNILTIENNSPST